MVSQKFKYWSSSSVSMTIFNGTIWKQNKNLKLRELIRIAKNISHFPTE